MSKTADYMINMAEELEAGLSRKDLEARLMADMGMNRTEAREVVAWAHDMMKEWQKDTEALEGDYREIGK